MDKDQIERFKSQCDYHDFGIWFNDKTKQIAVKRLFGKYEIINYADVRSIQMHESTDVVKNSSFSEALIGGLLGGGIGATVGAFDGMKNKRTVTYIKNPSVDFFVGDDVSKPPITKILMQVKVKSNSLSGQMIRKRFLAFEDKLAYIDEKQYKYND